MNIENDLTNGCDKMSRVYGDMFNTLQELMQDEEKLKGLSPLDYSAMGLYIGKFVEQEINSSVVQAMRAFCGIEMPKYYCKRYPGFDVNAGVFTGKKIVNLNEQKSFNDSGSLKSIPLGDASHALEQLKVKDKDGYFDKYPWLSDSVFLEAWRNLNTFRNKMAHIGEIIDLETLKEGYEQFLRFLKFMPDILAMKKDLAPEDYIDSLPFVEKKTEEERPYFTSTDNREKPYAPKEVAERYCELSKLDVWEDMKLMDEINGIIEKYNLDAMIFEGPDGKKGMKDCLGNILVPAKYDGFGFIPRPLEFPRESVIAVRDESYVVVALDGSGRELTNNTYDKIGLIFYDHMYSQYIYRKNGLKSYGFMDMQGNEMCDCIVDKYYYGFNCVEYESGELMGLWQFGVIFLPPVYDNIEMPGEPWDPYLFTLNGVKGYVRNDDGSFMPLEEFKKLDEDEQHDMKWNFICEQYELG